MEYKVKINDISFDEYAMAKACFEFQDKPIRTLVNSLIDGFTTIELFKLVIKYLLQTYKLAPNQILHYIKQYSVVISYYFVVSSKNSIIKNDDLDEMLQSPITLEKLDKKISGKDVFKTWFNGDAKKKAYNNKFKPYLEHENDTIKQKFIRLNRIASFEYNFFSANTNLTLFATKDKIKRFDMILAEAISEPSFKQFAFSIPEKEYDAFADNLTKCDKETFTYSYVLMGYIVFDLFLNDNLSFKNKINCIKTATLQILSLKRKAAIKLKFIDKNNNMIDIYNITPFKFFFNDKEYCFTKNGII